MLPFDEEDERDEESEAMHDIDDLEEMAEDEEGIDLFGDTFERDYGQTDENNRYQGDYIDDEEQDEDGVDLGARRQLEARMYRRDRETERRRRVPAAFLDDADDDEAANDVADLTRQPRRRRNRYDEEREDVDMGEDGLEELSLSEMYDVKAANVTDWVVQPQVLRSIYREFKRFLTEFTDAAGFSVYGNKIKTLGEVNSASLEVSYADLAEVMATLSFFLANEPTEVLKVFDQVALDVTLFHYPQYHDIHNEIHVRITDVPVTYTLRQLRQHHLNCLVRVAGVVTRRSGVFPQLKYVMFVCQKCNITLGPFQQEASAEVKISYCQNCQSKGPFTVNSEKTVYRNYQKLTLQESPGSVPAGRLPRQREVILLADLIDTAKPGDEVEVVGIYRNSYDAQLNNKNGFPVFSTIIEANHVIKSHDQQAGFQLTEDDERTIRALAREPDVVDRIVRSIAPSIYGHEDVKTAIALSLFGGVSKEAHGRMGIRGDINVLLLGDPGTAKSQFLKYTEKTAHRAVFATGQGASAVGLTASVRRDPLTSEWTLEGGALVLADRGTCLIDEFDKMNDQDRTSIHEAMEQQTISISKAGIVTTLHARCAVVAAANPIHGRYNSTAPFSDNVQLTEPILSRFDILCVIRDTVQPEEDERLASFVVESHHRANPLRPVRDHTGVLRDPHTNHRIDDEGYRVNEHGDRLPLTPEEVDRRDADARKREDEQDGEIPQELLRKYILYARERCQPKLYQIDQDKIARLFADMRRESLATGAYPITVRHLEAIIRTAEAFCKMRLSDYCSAQDIDRAIAVTVDSFIGAQKLSCKKALARAFAKYVILSLSLSLSPVLWQLANKFRYTLSRPKPMSKRKAGVTAPERVGARAQSVV